LDQEDLDGLEEVVEAGMEALVEVMNPIDGIME